MSTKPLELQSAARRRGLKLIRDRYSAPTVQKRYFEGRALGGRRIAAIMSLDEIEIVLKGWREPMPNATARFPWQAVVVTVFGAPCWISISSSTS